MRCKRCERTEELARRIDTAACGWSCLCVPQHMDPCLRASLDKEAAEDPTKARARLIEVE
jgi:hypothetical protein